jgi:cell pole-organizing protein PopZ
MTASAKIQEPSMEEILASIRRIIADDQDGARPQPAASAPVAPAPPPPADNDVLDLADLQPSPNQPKLELEPDDISFRDADGQIDFDSIGVEDEPLPPPAPAPAYVPPRAAVAPPPAPDMLLSNTTGASVAGAFQMLSATVLSNQARTLEDLVQDMLRPMLKGWLDENLPGMVERLVRAEIERVSRGGR